jgi:hypothetical protein
MHRQHLPYAVLLIGLLVTTLLGTGVATAQGIGVKIQPSLIEEKVNPGQVIEGMLTVSNEAGGTITFMAGTRDIVGMSEGGAPQFAKEEDEKRAAAWITPLASSVTLGVGENGQIPYRITVPVDAEPGTHSAAIFITKEADETVAMGAGVGFHVASLVSMRVSGDIVDDLLVRSFSTKRVFNTTASAEFTVRLENNGNVTQRPQGVIAIHDMLGNKVADVPFNETGGGILPHAERVFNAPWSSDSFSLGRYTVMLSVVYGDEVRKTITRELSFWVVPIKELGIALGTIVLLLGIAFLSLRAYVRKELRRAGHTPKSAETRERTFAQRLSRTLGWLIVLIVLAFIGLMVFYQ